MSLGEGSRERGGGSGGRARQNGETEDRTSEDYEEQDAYHRLRCGARCLTAMGW